MHEETSLVHALINLTLLQFSQENVFIFRGMNESIYIKLLLFYLVPHSFSFSPCLTNYNLTVSRTRFVPRMTPLQNLRMDTRRNTNSRP